MRTSCLLQRDLPGSSFATARDFKLGIKFDPCQWVLDDFPTSHDFYDPRPRRCQSKAPTTATLAAIQ